MNAPPEAVSRVENAAKSLGLVISVQIMPSTTRTADDAAAACQCPVGAIVKSLVFQGKHSARAYLFLVSGENRLSEEKAADAVAEPVVRPDAKFVRSVTGYAIGGIPPIGHSTPLVPLIDEDLLQYETVWAAAGTPNAVFSVNPAKLARAASGRIIDIRADQEG